MTSRSARSPPALAEDLVVVGPERRLVGGSEEVLHLDLLGAVVEDRRFDRPLEELVGVAAEELVERVLARDVDGEPAALPAGPAPHLPEAGDRPGEVDADRGVELADVDPELERVGGGDGEQVARGELRLDLAALLRRVAGAVGGDPVGHPALPPPDELVEAKRLISSMPRRLRMKQIVRTPRETSSTSRSAASETGERRVIVRCSITGGFHIAISRPARGAPSSSSSSNGRPVSRSASSPGLAIVAEANTKRGSAP